MPRSRSSSPRGSPDPECCQQTAAATRQAANTLDACSKSGAFQVRVIQDISSDEHQAVKRATRQAANTLDACSVSRAFQVDLIRNKVGISTIAKQDELIAAQGTANAHLSSLASDLDSVVDNGAVRVEVVSGGGSGGGDNATATNQTIGHTKQDIGNAHLAAIETHVDGIEGGVTTVNTQLFNANGHLSEMAGTVQDGKVQVEVVGDVAVTGAGDATAAHQVSALTKLHALQTTAETANSHLAALISNTDGVEAGQAVSNTHLGALAGTVSGGKLQVEVAGGTGPGPGSGLATASNQEITHRRLRRNNELSEGANVHLEAIVDNTEGLSSGQGETNLRLATIVDNTSGLPAVAGTVDGDKLRVEVIGGSISFPPGAATAANQTVANDRLTTIAVNTAAAAGKLSNISQYGSTSANQVEALDKLDTAIEKLEQLSETLQNGSATITSFAQRVAFGQVPGYLGVTFIGFHPSIDARAGRRHIMPLDTAEYYGQGSGPPATLQIHSSSAQDRLGGAGGHTVRVYGFRTSDSIEEESEDVHLDGTNNVTLANTWFRVLRAQVMRHGSNGINLGRLELADANDARRLYLTIEPNEGRSTFGVYTVPEGSAAYLGHISIHLSQQYGSSTSATITMWTKKSDSDQRGFMFRKWIATTGQPVEYRPRFAARIEPRTDIIFCVENVGDDGTAVALECELMLERL